MSYKITSSNKSDPFASGTLANLTKKQYEDLEKVASLSPGYSFEVFRYHEHDREKGSSATNVAIWRDGNEDYYVGLVGKSCCQYYDGRISTRAACLRVAHRVYRTTPHFEPQANAKGGQS